MIHPSNTRNIRNLLSYIVLTSIYLTGQYIDTGLGFTFYWFYVPYLLVMFVGIMGATKFNYKILLFILAITLYSLATYNYGLALVVKQLVNIIFSLLSLYFFLKMEKFDFESIFRKYILVSKIVLLLGFLQVFLYSVGQGKFFTLVLPFLQNTNISYRFQSITAEPSFLTLGFVPVVFLALHTLFYGRSPYLSKTWSLLFVLGFLLTFAATAYFGLIIMLIILYFKNLSYRKLTFAGVALGFIFLLAWGAYRQIPLIKVRVDDTVEGVTGDFTGNDNYKKLNISTYILIANLYVTKECLEDHPLTGTGLGTHELTYDKYLPRAMKEYSSLNRKDAGSMALRLLTETGIIGFFVFCFFTVKYKLKSSKSFSTRENLLWIINSSALVLIALYLLRNGNYTINGKILFLLMYYYTFIFFVNEKKNRHISDLNP